MDYYYYSSMTDADLGPGYYIGISIVGIIAIIAWWKIFTKAGEKGWKILIPFYNIYIMYKLFWKPAIFVILIILYALTAAGSIAASYGLTAAFLYGGGSAAFTVGLLLVVVCSIIALILNIIFYYKLSKSFGHGAGYTVGLIFLNVIFLLILAFGSSRYIGGDGERLDAGEEAGTYRYREPEDR